MAVQTYNSAFLSQRACALLAIIAIHVLIVYAISNGLAARVMDLVAPPIQTEIIEKIEEREAPPEPTLPEMEQPRIEVPRPVVHIEIPIETPTAITQVAFVANPTPVAVTVTPAPVAAPRHRIVLHANVGKNFPNVDDFYPPASQRLEEQGAVGVKVCIGPNGKLAGAPAVARSSGFSRLDEAAVKLARAGHYVAGSVDGVPVTECLQLPIRFRMKS